MSVKIVSNPSVESLGGRKFATGIITAGIDMFYAAGYGTELIVPLVVSSLNFTPAQVIVELDLAWSLNPSTLFRYMTIINKPNGVAASGSSGPATPTLSVGATGFTLSSIGVLPENSNYAASYWRVRVGSKWTAIG